MERAIQNGSATEDAAVAKALALQVKDTFGLAPGAVAPGADGSGEGGKSKSNGKAALLAVAERVRKLAPLPRLSLLRGITHAVDVPALLVDCIALLPAGAHDDDDDDDDDDESHVRSSL